ncbi:hypothetical protein [Paremcibacter congregatus]|uniref:CDP-alcohol phosphatidyltransferase n=1 Tax=Paremcibacter congregatus TaxID=2043170 RepID=A0A2G4YTY6_9PROT|nr:hypothetical protein [Paremcibacter congregatus]PHZ85804.1 hypothetical protein CRD36_03750 [Paremcibacter congregatus]QDE26767.1 hypothetical protein FIV45_05515 [Paremcibacter congregatus]
MARKALLITGQESETVSTLARNLIEAGGMSLFARQMMQMQAAGVEEMHVVTDWFAQEFTREIENTRQRPERVLVHGTKDAPLKLLEHNMDGNCWFLLEEGVLLDDRIIQHVAQHPAPTAVALIPPLCFLEERTTHGIPVQFENIEGFFGSIAKLSSQTLSATVRKLNSLEGLPNALKAISRTADCAIVNVTDCPLYKAPEGREVDLVWYPLLKQKDGDTATDIMLHAAHRVGQDAAARFLYRPLEDFGAKWLSKAPILPLHIYGLAGLLGLYVTYLFAAGYIVPALICGFAFGILTGIDQKLAHLKRRTSKIDAFKPLINATLEWTWYLAIAYALYPVAGMASYILVLTLIAFRLADQIQVEFFRRMAACPLYNAAAFDRKFQIIASGRNISLWLLLPFVLFDYIYLGLAVISIYAIVTFFIHQLRVLYHTKALMEQNSDIFQRNFKQTKIL